MNPRKSILLAYCLIVLAFSTLIVPWRNPVETVRGNRAGLVWRPIWSEVKVSHTAGGPEFSWEIDFRRLAVIMASATFLCAIAYSVVPKPR